MFDDGACNCPIHWMTDRLKKTGNYSNWNSCVITKFSLYHCYLRIMKVVLLGRPYLWCSEKTTFIVSTRSAFMSTSTKNNKFQCWCHASIMLDFRKVKEVNKTWLAVSLWKINLQSKRCITLFWKIPECGGKTTTRLMTLSDARLAVNNVVVYGCRDLRNG